MSADKAFDKWHKRFRWLDRNDARIAFNAGRELEQELARRGRAQGGMHETTATAEHSPIRLDPPIKEKAE